MAFQRTERGYILLVTLMLLALASLALLAVTRASLARSADTREAERHLQERWSTLSCSRSLLPRAEAVLAAAEATSHVPIVSVRKTLQLNAMPVELVFGDESAKANVNSLLERGREDATVAARQLLSGTGLAGRLELRPERLLAGRVGSLVEVFGNVRPEELLDGRQPASDRLSAWGDGRINAYRASPDVLKAVLSPTLNVSHLTQIAALRSATPRPSLSTMLGQLELTAPQRQFAEARLAGDSTCHSLWVITTEPRRRAHRLIVYDGSAPPARRTHTFEW